MCARRVNFSISVYTYVHDCVCVCLSVHASFMHPTICVSASANHNGHFMILAPSFHRAVSQSQPADESQVPAGLTLNRREKKIFTCLQHVHCFFWFLFCCPHFTACTLHTYFTPLIEDFPHNIKLKRAFVFHSRQNESDSLH